jgi:hypothetical protein
MKAIRMGTGWGDETVPTGIKRNASFDENFAAIMSAAAKYGPDRVADKLRFLKQFRWTGHRQFQENCDCLICQLENALFVEAYVRK